jgi:hypothetical protein
MNPKLRAAITGGVLMGLLSAIPYVNIANCCCVWVLFGGALAAYLYIKSSKTPVLMAEGVQVGALTGAIGGLINLLIGLPLNLLAGNPGLRMVMKMIERLNPEQTELMRQRFEEGASQPFLAQYLSALPGALVGLVMFVLFATLGGLLAVVIFEKRKGEQEGPPPPPSPLPPPSVVGTQPGAGYSAENTGGP